MKDVLVCKMYADKIVDNINQTACYKAVIAGGYPRDLYFGKQPTDIDIFVSCDNPEIPEYIRKYFIADLATNIMGATPNTKGDYNNATFSTFKYDIGIDVILMKDSFRSFIHHDVAQFAVQYFDCNINQFVIRNNKPVFVGKNENKFDVISLENSSPHRLNRFIQYAKEVNWL
jgi:tRNA nucleotidyltransferase/poly(A) polymerase